MGCQQQKGRDERAAHGRSGADVFHDGVAKVGMFSFNELAWIVPLRAMRTQTKFEGDRIRSGKPRQVAIMETCRTRNSVADLRLTRTSAYTVLQCIRKYS